MNTMPTVMIAMWSNLILPVHHRYRNAVSRSFQLVLHHTDVVIDLNLRRSSDKRQLLQSVVAHVVNVDLGLEIGAALAASNGSLGDR